MNVGQHGARLQGDPAFLRLKDVVIEHTGLAYYHDKDDVLATRIGKRLADSGNSDCQSYLDLISSPNGEDELDALIKELTVGETFFFRYSEQYDSLRELVFPELLRRNRHTRRLRIWSAGCSTGAEAYSVAILLRRAFGALLQDWDITIIGTDINRAFLSAASVGRYNDWALRDLPDDVRTSCFVRDQGQWLLNPAYRQGVSFQYHNLIKHPLPSIAQHLAGFDVILCRNVMIYFSADVVETLLSRLEHCLNEGAWLLVGHAENMASLNTLYLPVSVPGATIYRKRQAGSVTAAPAAPPKTLTESVAHLLSPLSVPAPGPSSMTETHRASEVARHGSRRASGYAGGKPTPSAVPPDFGIEAVLALANQGELEEAATRCDALIAAQPANSTLYFYNGVIRSQMDQASAAEQSLLRAIEFKDTPFPLAHYHLGLLRQNQRPSQARMDFSAALRAVADLDGALALECGDGMRVSELVEIVDLQLEMISKR